MAGKRRNYECGKRNRESGQKKDPEEEVRGPSKNCGAQKTDSRTKDKHGSRIKIPVPLTGAKRINNKPGYKCCDKLKVSKTTREYIESGGVGGGGCTNIAITKDVTRISSNLTKVVH